MSTEKLDNLCLEQFRDPNYPFLYWVEDSLIEVVLKETKRRYGLEIGFGYELTRVFLIDPNIDWILTEPLKDRFINAKDNLEIAWGGQITSNVGGKIFAVNCLTTKKMVSEAKIILARNPHPSFFYKTEGLIPNIESLNTGQRLVIVENQGGESGVVASKEDLGKLGYHPSLFIKIEPILAHVFDRQDEECVFDFTK